VKKAVKKKMKKKSIKLKYIKYNVKIMKTTETVKKKKNAVIL